MNNNEEFHVQYTANMRPFDMFNCVTSTPWSTLFFIYDSNPISIVAASKKHNFKTSCVVCHHVVHTENTRETRGIGQ